ncbi:hypothetical protein, partial [Gemmatimonas sp.]|uniref:hypothetical protein n=1 Tax=Gemmatimonas sp. TaxID=1962908 RepID=UPI0035620B11
LGLGQMLLADHDGPWDRRDWIGMVLGIIAVTSSGVVVTMMAVVFGATWARRTLRIALAQVGPAAFVYLAWSSTAGRREGGFGTPGSIWRFVHMHAWGLVQSLSDTAWLAPLWIGLVTLGLAATVIAVRRQGRRSPVVPVAALASGALLFSVSTGAATEIVPWYDVVWPAPRHLHVLATFLLPAMAVGADRIVGDRRAWRAALIALVLIPLPLGFVHLGEQRASSSAAYSSNPRLILGIPRLSFAEQLPSDLEPDRAFHPGATVGWLLDLGRRGLLPEPPPTSPRERAGIAAVVALAETRYDGSTLKRCTTLGSSTGMVLQAGDRLVVVNAPAAVQVVYEGVASVPTTVKAEPYYPGVRTARVGPLTLKVTSIEPDDPVTVCTLP